jgi:hypothetical protein
MDESNQPFTYFSRSDFYKQAQFDRTFPFFQQAGALCDRMKRNLGLLVVSKVIKQLNIVNI